MWKHFNKWAPSSEFVSSSIPSGQILTAHDAQPFRGARDLAFCLMVPLDSLLVWASSGGSGETARMRRLTWTFAARIGDNTKFAWRGPNTMCSKEQEIVKWSTNSQNVFVVFYRRDRASLNNSISILLVWRKIFKDERYAREKRVRNCFKYWSWIEQRWKESEVIRK